MDIRRDAKAMLEQMLSAGPEEIAAKLKPKPEDYEAVFVPEVAERAYKGYDLMWLSLPKHFANPGQTEVLVWAAPAALLREENEYSHQFPGGYRRIADKLQPDKIWVRWKFVEPGSSTGMAYDGLVWLEDRWAWFPKPWRIIGDD